jgi:hypothetical protein
VPHGSAIRGTRVGSGPIRPVERCEPAPRREVTYWCSKGHWDCPRCGQQAGQDAHNPPGPSRAEPYKTHLAYVKERRSDADGEAILAEALAALRHRRGEF